MASSEPPLAPAQAGPLAGAGPLRSVAARAGAVLYTLGAVLVLLSALMLAPLGLAFAYGDAALGAYDAAFLVTLGAGLALVLASYRTRGRLQVRDGFLLVTLVWGLLPAFAALPLLFYLEGLSFTDAYFEAMAGFTTTGATVLEGLDALPPSINLWRALLQWLGGMGILVLAVAILPLLGVGGRQLYRAETPGPMKEAQLTPRIAETAKALWAVYAALTAANVLAYRLAGMSWLDAVIHAFSTMSTGGFSSHDASFGYFDSPAIEAVAIVFMLIAGVNFSTHFLVWRKRTLRPYRDDPEALWFLLAVLGASLLVAAYLRAEGVYSDAASALRYAAFNVVSIATTTGYASTNFGLWPAFAPFVMLLLCATASSAGSTGGGIKMVRARLLLLQGWREMIRLLHPQAQVPIRLGARVVPNAIVFAVLAFMSLYGATVTLLTLVLLASGLDFLTAFSAVIACITNTGPGLGAVGPATTYRSLGDFQTWVLSFAMLVGRLEIFTVFVLFTPAFWRR